MKIVPVLDVLNSVVVHGVGGQRQNYRPIKSHLTNSTQPVEVADALHVQFGFTEFYVADLDAITGAEPNWPLYAALRAHGFQLWVDAGVIESNRVVALAKAGVARIIAGLESLAGPHVLAEISHQFGDKTIFSLDLRSGWPLGARSAWKGDDAWTILEEVLALGVGTVLLLDLARVGMQTGTGTEALAARLATTYPNVEVFAGGGVRGMEDLRQLEQSGVCGVLLATALHAGIVTRVDVANFAR